MKYEYALTMHYEYVVRGIGLERCCGRTAYSIGELNKSEGPNMTLIS
jgi:hypothetical protein